MFINLLVNQHFHTESSSHDPRIMEGASIQSLVRKHQDSSPRAGKIPREKGHQEHGPKSEKNTEYCSQNLLQFNLHEPTPQSYIKGAAIKIDEKEKKKDLGNKYQASVWASNMRQGQQHRHWHPSHRAVAPADWTSVDVSDNEGCLKISRGPETQKIMIILPHRHEIIITPNC